MTQPLDLAALEARVRELETESAALTKALTGLTCNGSEFFIRKGDRYVADIEACVAWITNRDRKAHRREIALVSARKAADARDERDALRAEVERLREGLEVLGALSDVTYDQCSEYSPRAYGEGRIDALLTVQRIVRAALLPTSQPLKVDDE